MTAHELSLRIFWMVATLEVGLAIRLAVELRRNRAAQSIPHRDALARGQRKDNWLVSAVVWTVLPSEGWPLRSCLVLLAVLILAWLMRRTMHRLRMLENVS